MASLRRARAICEYTLVFMVHPSGHDLLKPDLSGSSRVSRRSSILETVVVLESGRKSCLARYSGYALSVVHRLEPVRIEDLCCSAAVESGAAPGRIFQPVVDIYEIDV